MERKFKVMGIYVGLFFFAVILLVLVTSFSNTELNPSYDAETEDEYQVTFNHTIQQSVNSLTEMNEELMSQVDELEKKVEEKEKTISEYEKKNSSDKTALENAARYYIADDNNSAAAELDKINIENLDKEDLDLYNQLNNKLNR